MPRGYQIVIIVAARVAPAPSHPPYPSVYVLPESLHITILMVARAKHTQPRQPWRQRSKSLGRRKVGREGGKEGGKEGWIGRMVKRECSRTMKPHTDTHLSFLPNA